MWFKIINNKKFLLISIFVFLYLALNLFDGERGLISYFEKKQILNNLKEDENNQTQTGNKSSKVENGKKNICRLSYTYE